MNLAKEMSKIATSAFKLGVDPYFIAAILSEEPQAKLEDLAEFVQAKVITYGVNPLIRKSVKGGTMRLCYTDSFIAYCAQARVKVEGFEREKWRRAVLDVYDKLVRDPDEILRYRHESVR